MTASSYRWKTSSHILINIGAAVLDFTGANTAIFSEMGLLTLASMIVAVARLFGKVFEFSDLHTPISPMLIF
jgi:hypothetical protein